MNVHVWCVHFVRFRWIRAGRFREIVSRSFQIFSLAQSQISLRQSHVGSGSPISGEIVAQNRHELGLSDDILEALDLEIVARYLNEI